MTRYCGNESFSYRHARLVAAKMPGVVHIVDAYDEPERHIPARAGRPAYWQTAIYVVPADELENFSAQHGHRINIAKTMRDGEVIG